MKEILERNREKYFGWRTKSPAGEALTAADSPNHQGLENELIAGAPAVEVGGGPIRRRQRLGGLLNHYCRAA